MPVFPSAAQIQRITAPLVIDATKQLGSKVDVYAIVSVRQPDGSSVLMPALQTPNVPVLLTMLTSDKAQSVFGLNTEIKMQGVVPKSVAEINNGAVLNVVTGGFAGLWFTVATEIDQPLSDSYTLGLLYSRPYP